MGAAKRIVIVGASTGLGRSMGIALAGRGSHVALLARSEDLIASAAAEAGDNAHAIRCDVTDEGAAPGAIAEAAEKLGGIDAVIYSTGIGQVCPIEEITSEMWQRTFATNVIGASHVTAAALPHLKESNGTAVFLTSISSSLTPSWPGLAVYNVTKAALDRLVDAWRVEHPEVGFTKFVVGECPGTIGGAGQSHFAAGWDPEMAMRFYPTWSARGLMTDKLVDVDDLINLVDAVTNAGASASFPTVAVTPRRPI